MSAKCLAHNDPIQASLRANVSYVLASRGSKEIGDVYTQAMARLETKPFNPVIL